MKVRQETIFSDRESIRSRDIELLARDFNLHHDDPLIQAIMTAWDYGYMEAIMKEQVSHETHKDN